MPCAGVWLLSVVWFHGGAEEFGENGAELPMFAPVSAGQPGKQRFALFRNDHKDHPGVLLAGGSAHKPMLFEPVDEPNAGVVANLQRLGQIADRGLALSREPADREQELVLLGG